MRRHRAGVRGACKDGTSRHGKRRERCEVRTFKSLPVGARFEFSGDNSRSWIREGFARGPWVKVSARKYRHEQNGYLCRVGSALVEVVLL